MCAIQIHYLKTIQNPPINTSQFNKVDFILGYKNFSLTKSRDSTIFFFMTWDNLVNKKMKRFEGNEGQYMEQIYKNTVAFIL